MFCEFSKWEAFGNDFIIIERPPSQEIIDLVPKLCHRQMGIGSDGLIFLNYQKQEMHFYNADGTTASMCGNGLRCVMYLLLQMDLPLQILFDQSQYVAHFDHNRLFVQMPIPRLLKKINDPYDAMWIKAGVPHCLIPTQNLFQKNFLNRDFQNRYHDTFAPAGSNLTFFEITGSNIFLRTLERGVEQETMACGSAAIAVSYHVDKPFIECIYKSGKKAFVKKEKQHVFLSGDARFVFKGTFGCADFSKFSAL